MENITQYQQYLPTLEAVVKLFNPFVEAAVHDLRTGTIAALYNNISDRKVGDSSPLKELGLPIDKFPDAFEPYYKTNWDGRKLKCVSITLRDNTGNPVALICFNLDTTVFRSMELNLRSLLEVSRAAENPVELFNEDWQRKVESFIADHLSKNKLLIERINQTQRRELVQELARHGIFNYKKAASYVAGQLHISRASVYNYMK